MTVEAKICGLRSAEAVVAAVKGGATSLGFVFFDRSPRNISVMDVRNLTAGIPPKICKVGLVVDAGDEFLSEISAGGFLDMLQLHGQETPARVAEIRERFGLPVMKAIAVEEVKDLETAREYEDVVDRLMFDAKPPKGATRPGGNAVTFDWKLLQGITWKKPWVLAGGLTPENVIAAVRTSGADAVDVSSGVEDAPGTKSIAKIGAFLSAVQSI
jgi:phosphoribosylanthranilate isomerase